MNLNLQRLRVIISSVVSTEIKRWMNVKCIFESLVNHWYLAIRRIEELYWSLLGPDARGWVFPRRRECVVVVID